MIKILISKLILFGIMISKFGSSIQSISMPLYILKITGSTAKMGSVYAIGIYFGMVALLFSGYLADNYNKKYILVTCDMLSALILISSSFFFNGDENDIKIILLIQILTSFVYRIFSTSLSAIIPQLFKDENLGQINSLKSSLSATASIVAPVIGTFLFLNYGIKAVLIVNGFSFFISALIECSLKYLFIKKKDHSPFKKNILRSTFKSMSGVIRADINILKIFIVALVINFIVSPIFPILLPKLLLSTDLEKIYGTLGSIVTIGVLISSYLTGKLIIRFKLLSMLNIGIFIIGFSFGILVLKDISQIYLYIFSFIFGLSLSFINIPIDSYFQEKISEQYLGKFFSSLDFIAELLVPLSLFLFGLLLEFIAYQYIFLVFIIIAFSLALFLKFYHSQ